MIASRQERLLVERKGNCINRNSDLTNAVGAMAAAVVETRCCCIHAGSAASASISWTAVDLQRQAYACSQPRGQYVSYLGHHATLLTGQYAAQRCDRCLGALEITSMLVSRQTIHADSHSCTQTRKRNFCVIDPHKTVLQ